jgi:two-component system NarL family sensor kinase
VQANEMVGQAINDLRELSKSLDADFVNEFGLEQSTTHELSRIRKTRRFQTHFSSNGEPFSMGQQKEIVLFRIVQEILNNAIKHSRAKNINVAFDYTESTFSLTVADDGVGFDWRLLQQKELSNSGSGLRNIQRRVNLIGGTCEFDSVPGQGTTITIRIAEKA